MTSHVPWKLRPDVGWISKEIVSVGGETKGSKITFPKQPAHLSTVHNAYIASTMFYLHRLAQPSLWEPVRLNRFGAVRNRENQVAETLWLGHRRNNRDVQINNKWFGMSIELISMAGCQIRDKPTWLLLIQGKKDSLKSRAPEDSRPFKLGRRTLEGLEIFTADSLWGWILSKGGPAGG